MSDERKYTRRGVTALLAGLLVTGSAGTAAASKGGRRRRGGQKSNVNQEQHQTVLQGNIGRSDARATSGLGGRAEAHSENIQGNYNEQSQDGRARNKGRKRKKHSGGQKASVNQKQSQFVAQGNIGSSNANAQAGSFGSATATSVNDQYNQNTQSQNGRASNR